MFFQQLAKRSSHGNLVVTRTCNIPRDTEDPCASIVAETKTVEPGAPLLQDERHCTEGLDIVDHRRKIEQAMSRREGRLLSREGVLSFQRVQERCFFTTDVGTSATTNHDPERPTGSAGIIPQHPGCLGLIDRHLQ